MIAIVNELSMAGQFTQDSFIEGLPKLVNLLKVLGKMKFQLSKKSDFYNCCIIGTMPFRNFLVNHKSDESVRLKTTLLPLTDTAPFWDMDQQHSCNDSYACAYTDLTCNYGLAESIEVERLVFSFDHQDFLGEELQISKNTEEMVTANFTSIATLVRYIFRNLDSFDFSTYVPELTDKKELFPNNAISNLLLEAETIEERMAHLHQDQRISHYTDAGRKIAAINLWELCPATTAKNDRNIYKRRIQAGYCFLSIDTQHGRFELFDNAGNHIGEYHFTGVSVPDSRSNRSINV